MSLVVSYCIIIVIIFRVKHVIGNNRKCSQTAFHEETFLNSISNEIKISLSVIYSKYIFCWIMVYLTVDQAWSSELPSESTIQHHCHHKVRFLSFFSCHQKNSINSSEKPESLIDLCVWGLTKQKKVRSWARVNISRNPCLLGAPSVPLAIHSPHCQIHPPTPLIQTNSAWVCGSEVACMFRFVGLVFFITSTDRIPMMQLLIF